VALVAGQTLSAPVLGEVSDQLLHEARSAGGFRRVVTIIQLAQMFARNASIERKHVVRAIGELRQIGGEE
jgi:hypothetical protein